MKRPLCHILVMDSNPHVSKFLCREFEENGFKASVAGSGQQLAAAFQRTERPDILVFDPDLNNPEIIAGVSREMALHPEMKLVIHSFDGEAGPGQLNAKASALVEKNSNPSKLVRTVRRLAQFYFPSKFK